MLAISSPPSRRVGKSGASNLFSVVVCPWRQKEGPPPQAFTCGLCNFLYRPSGAAQSVFLHSKEATMPLCRNKWAHNFQPTSSTLHQAAIFILLPFCFTSFVADISRLPCSILHLARPPRPYVYGYGFAPSARCSKKQPQKSIGRPAK